MGKPKLKIAVELEIELPTGQDIAMFLWRAASIIGAVCTVVRMVQG